MQPLLSRRALLLACSALPFAARATLTTPMLANVYRPGTDIADYWVSEKFDGVRGCWDGERLRTRHGRLIAAPAWFTEGLPSQALDGELWVDRGQFEAASATLAKQVPVDAQWRQIHYMVFDLPTHPGRFSQRVVALSGLVGKLSAPWVQMVEQQHLPDEAALHSLLRETLARGGEGLMLHRGDSFYRGDRSDDLLKLKEHLDAEAVVIAHVAGHGKYEGMTGALLMQTPEGLKFRLGTGLKDADRASPPPIGSHVTYRYRGLHPDGAPRFASFVRVRED